MKRMYIVPFNREQGYIDAYLSFYNDRIFVLSSMWDCLGVPPFSIVFIEDPHKFMWTFFLRLDVYLIHVPRGGGGFKIGWRSDERTKWYIWFKLWRRNCIVCSSEFFIPYFRYEERIHPFQKIVVASEPLIEYHKHRGLKARKTSVKRVLIALGDRAVESDYERLHEKLCGYEVLNSVHPRLNLQIEGDTFLWEDIDLVILDKSVSMSLFLSRVGIPFIVLEDYETGRPMAYDAQSLFTSMIPYKKLQESIENGKYSDIRFSLEERCLTEIF